MGARNKKQRNDKTIYTFLRYLCMRFGRMGAGHGGGVYGDARLDGAAVGKCLAERSGRFVPDRKRGAAEKPDERHVGVGEVDTRLSAVAGDGKQYDRNEIAAFD